MLCAQILVSIKVSSITATPTVTWGMGGEPRSFQRMFEEEATFQDLLESHEELYHWEGTKC